MKSSQMIMLVVAFVLGFLAKPVMDKCLSKRLVEGTSHNDNEKKENNTNSCHHHNTK